jgi:hypothetical protein
VTDLLQRLLRLWTEPIGDGVAARARSPQLVDRAPALQQSFEGLSMQMVDQVETSDGLVLAFLMRGRHVGPYASQLGSIPPTGREVQIRTIES